MITNYTEFSKIEALKTKFGKLFTYCRVERNNLLCSDTLTKSEKPNVIEKNSTIFIDSDVSGGFWDYIKSRYPEYNWITL